MVVDTNPVYIIFPAGLYGTKVVLYGTLFVSLKEMDPDVVNVLRGIAPLVYQRHFTWFVSDPSNLTTSMFCFGPI